ncbi:General substrate transporter [Segniliparus rotundus DSM 44985]|uniref:General substrate transporter n=1 Tax=Segniliparus rotundus (strain ATCC BAA-972 / CDC 1076 / CIP 108378 / DSM 44985 / JCM 13578) TaxID=640132 RepID=D6Z7E0_SEGRD|nr:MFS transporter [Segniliparus rotundus]ADG97870.1 General substrate transporter [Segniliparus rotundus DSM 44985]
MWQNAKSQSAMVLRVVGGNFFEMYDFILFGIFAGDIARAYFPAHSHYISELAAFATFWLGSVMRPVGALVLGGYVDRMGRRKGLVVTLGIMATGTAAIAFTPDYAAIGVLAPLLVLLGRLLQGFSAGVELGGVSVYLAEAAPLGRKGFFVSWQSASQQAAVVVAALLGLLVREEIPARVAAEWGWRIPFVIGCLILPVLFFIRRSLQETEEFANKKHHPSFAEIRQSIANNMPVVLAGMGWVVMTTVYFYFITNYTPTFGREVLSLTSGQSLFVTLCVGVSNLVLLPVFGAMSDRVGRGPLLAVFSALGVLTAYPALLWLVGHPSLGHMAAVELWLSLLYAGYNGALVVALVEVMPDDVRTTGFSLAYSLATLVGTFTELGVTWLRRHEGNSAPGLWLFVASSFSLAATAWFWRGGFLRREAPTSAGSA